MLLLKFDLTAKLQLKSTNLSGKSNSVALFKIGSCFCIRFGMTAWLQNKLLLGLRFTAVYSRWKLYRPLKK